MNERVCVQELRQVQKRPEAKTASAQASYAVHAVVCQASVQHSTAQAQLCSLQVCCFHCQRGGCSTVREHAALAVALFDALQWCHQTVLQLSACFWRSLTAQNLP